MTAQNKIFMDKRYQVFVSSTFRDLQEERGQVIQALLELDCIPSGMELFPAADEDQWSYIQQIIDDCDYYVVFLAGKYCSISPRTGKSYTQMEYEYAIEKGKPVIAFLYENLAALPMERCEQEADRRVLLGEFRAMAQNKLCKHWSNADQLGGLVSRSMIQLIKRKPAVGWVRADKLMKTEEMQENAHLHQQVHLMNQLIKQQRGEIELAQGKIKSISKEKHQLLEKIKLLPSIEYPQIHSNSILLPTPSILLVVFEGKYGALQPVEQRWGGRNDRQKNFINYAWWYQPDGSGIFTNESAISGYSKATEGVYKGNILHIGPIEIEWSVCNNSSGWVYFDQSDQVVKYKLAITKEVNINDIDATLPKYSFIKGIFDE